MKPVVVVACLLLTVGVAALDFAASPELDLLLFYLIPLLVAAWYVGERFALLLAVIISSVVILDALRMPGMSALYVYWGAVARLVSFLIIAWAVAAVRTANDRLRASEALREDLTNMLVHDLKNPLTSSTMALDMLRRKVLAETSGSDMLEPSELLHIAQEGQERLRRLIEDLLDVARAEAGSPLALNTSRTDLVHVLRTAVQAFQSRARAARVGLEEHYPSANVILSMDAEKIQRVVENLLDNAIKNTPSQGQVEVSLEPDNGGARVTVRDTGPGIPRHLQNQIFNKFSQAAEPGRKTRMSVGLGLAFCRLAVEAHGGRIWVESGSGRGSAFIFSLPAEPPATKRVAQSLTP